MSQPEENAEVATGEAEEKTAAARTFGGLTAQEAAARSAETRRANKLRRTEDAEANALTFRQRVGVSLSKLTQTELDRAVKSLAASGRANDIGALVRLADQAFGRPSVQEEDAPQDQELAALTREQRAVVRAALAELEGEGSSAPTD